MKLKYPAFVHEDNDGVWVEFPDLEGCQSFGDTLEEALGDAQEALEGYCLTVMFEDRSLPAASDIRMLKPEENTFVSLIEAEIDTYQDKMRHYG